MPDIAAGETFSAIPPNNSVTSARLNNHVGGATILPAFVSAKPTTAPATADRALLYDVSGLALIAPTLADILALQITDAAANVGSMRTLGTGANQALPGDTAFGSHAVYPAASPPTIDVGIFTIVKTGIDLKTAATTAIFTVPPSRKFVATGVFVLVTAVTGAGPGTEQFQLKESGASGNMSGAQTSASTTPAVGDYYTEQITPTTAPYKSCATGNNVQISIAAGQQAGSTTVTGSVFVTGVYVS